MTYEIINPPAVLSNWVRHYFFIEQKGNAQSHVPFKLMADGFSNLIFQYNSAFQDSNNNNFYPPIILTGHTSKNRDLIACNNFGVCGIVFYPFAITYLFGIKADDFVNEVIDGRLLLKAASNETEERLAIANTNHKRADIFTSFLIKKLCAINPQTDIIHQSIQQIIQRQGTLHIEMLCKNVNISCRQMERKFSEHIGFSPKYYSRIIRFQSTLLHPSNSITDVAYSFGYADQAHFIREFQEFSGISPKHYFKETKEAAENFLEMN